MELPYDGDTDEPTQYCEHGTFIGSWWGPDYLCGWCEDGISLAEMHMIQARNGIYRAKVKLEQGQRFIEIVANAMVENRLPFNAATAQAMTNWVLNPEQGFENAWRLRHLV